MSRDKGNRCRACGCGWDYHVEGCRYLKAPPPPMNSSSPQVSEDHARIYLQPRCCVDENEGRQWCQDNVWPNDSECEETGVEYVRADLMQSARTPSDQGVGEAEREVVARAIDPIWMNPPTGPHVLDNYPDQANNYRTKAREAADRVLAIAQNTVPSGKDISDEVRGVVANLEASAERHGMMYDDLEAVEKAISLIRRLSGEG